MDSLTHVVVGMAIGQLTLGRKVGKKALLWGAVAANIPDIDGIFQYCFSPASSTLFHRGISHSLLLFALLSPLVAWGIFKLYKGKVGNLKGWLGLVSLAWASHLCLDVFNSYGTGLLEPFSHIRISYDAIGITDFFFVFPLVIAAILSIIMKKASRVPVIASTIALCLSFAYLGFAITNKQQVTRFAETELQRQNIPHTRILTSPLPITNFAWIIVAEDENGFWKGSYCTTTEHNIKFNYIPKNHNLASGIENVNDFKKLQRFSQGYYVLRKGHNGDSIILSDLRFGSLAANNGQGTLGGGLNFTLKTNPTDGKLIVERAHPDRNVTPSNVKQYIKRIVKKS